MNFQGAFTRIKSLKSSTNQQKYINVLSHIDGFCQGGSNETIIDEKTGFLFDAGDAKSLSKKILRVLSMDENLLKSMGNEGRKNVIKKFNVEKMCFSTYSEYKKLIN